jgi:phospho-N-acetylmuramoyl-pentapeptide-transferase
MPDITISVIKMFVVGALSFGVVFWLTPLLTHYLYKYKLWRKEVRTKSIDGKELVYFKKFHSEKETHVPRFGGLLIWLSVLIVAILFFILSFFNIWWFKKLNFLSRSQTWLPLFSLIAASLVGLVDDILQIMKKGRYIAGGLSLKWRLLMVALIGLIGGWWFYFKLNNSTIHIPGDGDFFIGIWYVLFFIVIMLAVYSGGVIDGIDGLGGGAFAIMFSAFGGISLFTGQIDIATFCFAIAGAILAFLWFNIPPARFYMGETGMLGLCCALTVVAFLTDSILVLPIIGFLLVIEAGSVILQLLWKKIFKKKLFLASPIHHHFEALGWPHYKITMRFWIIGVVTAIIGVAIRLLG